MTRRHRLLDRDADVAVLADAAATVHAGNGVLAVIEGPAGIGKTALLSDIRHRLQETGMQVFSARAGELEQDFGYGIVRQLLETRLLTASAAERAQWLSGAARLAEPVFATDAGATAGKDGLHATLHGLHWLVANLAESRPVAVIVDDAQWSDDPSMRFLRYLAQRRADIPVLITVAWRTGDERHEHLRALLLDADHVIRPDPLRPEAVALLVADELDLAPTDDLASACFRATGGNPFLLSELLGEIRRGSVPVNPERIGEAAPERVSVSVRDRVQKLGEAALSIARAVAILGDQARLLSCAELAGLSWPEARLCSQRLAEVGLLDDGEPLRFVHPLLRAAVVDDITAVERAELHARAARVLAAQHAEAGAIAMHLLATVPSGDPTTVRMLRNAAAQSISRGTPDIAVTLLRRALDEPPSPDERPAVLLELGNAEHEVDANSATDHLREAARTAGDAVTRARALTGLAWNAHTDPKIQRELFAQYGPAAADVRPFDRELALQLEAARLGAIIFSADLAPSFAEEAARYRDLPAETAAECLLRSFVARRTLELGDAQRAGDLAEQSTIHPNFESQAGHPLWRANVTFCLIEAERFDFAESILTRTIAHAARVGSVQWLYRASWLRGMARHRAGNLRGAESDARAALVGLPRPHLENATIVICEALTDQGRYAEAEGALRAAGLEGELPPATTSVLRLISRGRLRSASGDLERARADLSEALRQSEALHVLFGVHDCRVELSDVLRRLGDVEAARALAESSLTVARATGSRRGVAGSLRVLGLAQGGEKGLDTLRRSVNAFIDSPSRLWRAQALVDFGSALRRGGQSTAARGPLRDGIELAQKCGASVLAERGMDQLRAAGARPRRRPGSGVDSLTSSERRVAELAADGLTNKEIAQTLFVSLRTVEMHLSNTYTKLEIKSRQEVGEALAG